MQYEVTAIDRDDRHQRGMLNELMERVFGFSFEPWYAHGDWDGRYTPYCIIEGDRALANVSVAEMELLVGGQPVKSVQIGAVASLPECRGRGLARQLMAHVLERHGGVPAFLFANESVLDFYPKFGFERAGEGQPYLTLDRPTTKGDCQRLSLDSPVLRRHIAERRMFSRILDVRGADNISWFHAIMEFDGDIYHVPDHDAVIIARQTEDTAVIYDVMSHGDVAFGELLPHLPFSGAGTVEFAFTPDRLCDHFSVRAYDAAASDSYLFVRGLDFPSGAKFPRMATT